MATDADAQAYIDQIETDSGETVTGGHDSALDDLFQGLKTDGIYSKLDRLYIYANQPWEEASRRCLITLVQNFYFSNPSWSATGLFGDGVDDAVEHNYNPTNDAVNFALNSACYGIWFNEAVSGYHGHRRLAISDNNAGDRVTAWVNSTSNLGDLNIVDRDGLLHVNRVNSTNIVLYRNGTEEEDDSVTSDSIPNEQVMLFARRYDAGNQEDFSSNTVKASYIGGGLTPTEISDLYSRLNTYLSADISGDTTPPTLPADTTLSFTPKSGEMEVTYDKAPSDDNDDPSTFVYRLWRAAAGADISTAELCNQNGTEVASGTDVAQLIGAVAAMATDYEWNITVEDTSGNQAAYTQAQKNSGFYGNVKDAGVNDPEAVVQIESLPEDTDPTTQPTFVETAQTDADGNWFMATPYDPTKHYRASVGFWEEVYSGTADSATASSITDAGQFTAGEFDGEDHAVRTTGGTGSGQTRTITGNADTDTFNFSPDMNPVPDGTTQYQVVRWQSAKTQILLRTG